jgi:hypothetical protein
MQEIVHDRVNLLHVSLVVGCGFASRHLDEIQILDLERNRHRRRLKALKTRADFFRQRAQGGHELYFVTEIVTKRRLNPHRPALAVGLHGTLIKAPNDAKEMTADFAKMLC